MLEMIKSRWTIFAAGLAIGLALAAYMFSRYKRASEEISQYRSQVLELSQEMQRKAVAEHSKAKTVTVVTKQPDGTITERTERDEETTKVSEEMTDKKSSKETQQEQVSIVADLIRYQLGIQYPIKLEWDYKELGFDFGARLGDLPVFATVGGFPWKKTALLGLRYEL